MNREEISQIAKEASVEQAGFFELERFANALEQAILKKIGAPVAWEWRREYSNGGYVRDVFGYKARALDMAEDSKNLPTPDIITPLYKLPKELL